MNLPNTAIKNALDEVIEAISSREQRIVRMTRPIALACYLAGGLGLVCTTVVLVSSAQQTGTVSFGGHPLSLVMAAISIALFFLGDPGTISTLLTKAFKIRTLAQQRDILFNCLRQTEDKDPIGPQPDKHQIVDPEAYIEAPLPERYRQIQVLHEMQRTLGKSTAETEKLLREVEAVLNPPNLQKRQ